MFLFDVTIRDVCVNGNHRRLHGTQGTQRSLPKVLHQTWKDKHLTVQQQQDTATLWRGVDINIWENRFWTDAMFLPFVESHFSWFLPIWQKLDPFIKKVDTIRYMWMYVYGGIYIDVDIYALQNPSFLEKSMITQYMKPTALLLSGSSVLPYVTPALIRSDKKHPLWIHVLHCIEKSYQLKVVRATGPILLSKSVKSYRGQGTVVLQSALPYGIAQTTPIHYVYTPNLAIHRNAGTWL